MARAGDLAAAAMTRRTFLGLASAAVSLWAGRSSAGPPRSPVRAGAASGLAAREPALVLRVPPSTTNGERVPIVLESAHPMAPEHHLTLVRVTNDADPIASKGTFRFAPANGRVYLSFQARMHEGRARVTARAECSAGRTFDVERPVEIAGGGGG